jgi:hypothetical protein
MDIDKYIEDALTMVSAWGIPEDDFAQTVNDQARLLAGLELDPYPDSCSVSPYQPLRF